MDRYAILEEAVLSTNSDAIIAADKEGTIFFGIPAPSGSSVIGRPMLSGDHWTSSSRIDSGSALGTDIARS
jgi:hypothetical protein